MPRPVKRVEVSVLPRGFDYQGQIYRSLSAVAKVVTGNTDGNGSAGPASSSSEGSVSDPETARHTAEIGAST